MKWDKSTIVQWAKEHGMAVEDVCVVQIENLETGEVTFRYAKLPWYYKMDRDLASGEIDVPWGGDGFWCMGNFDEWDSFDNK